MYCCASIGPVPSCVTISVEQEASVLLCRTFVEENNMLGQCYHVTDADRAISGKWDLDDVRLAVTKGYKVVEIQEVFEYAVTQYDRATGVGGLFVEYINTFLKLKNRGQ